MVGREIKVSPVSSNVARVQDVVLSDPDEAETSGTRRILRSLIVPNMQDAEASVRATIMHQRRHKLKEPWRDANSFRLSKLHGGEEVKLELNARQTRRLFEALSDLYQISPGSWTKGTPQNVLVVNGPSNPDAAELLPFMLEAIEHNGPTLFKYIVKAKPNLVRAAAVMERHDERTAAVQDFESALKDNRWTEAEWEAFFASNTWIFGLNLGFQFLGTIKTQPKYVAPSVFGGGGQRGDFLLGTTGDARFTVVVDIKKPDALLVQDRPYRNRVYAPGPELSGGVAQLQSHCLAWEHKAQTDPEESIELDQRNISAVQPKGILIVGHTSSLGDRYKRDSFARFRRNTLNPEIVTYDELLERARFIVNAEAQEIPNVDDIDEDFDDVPFD